MLTTLLKHALIEAKAVGTGAQALSSVQAEPFDLYMLDSRLPDVDGFELCRRLRAVDPHTPILFFSGEAFEVDRNKGIEAGANAYVVKPDFDGLVRSIKQFASPAASPRAKIIPFKRKMSGFSPRPFRPAAT
jgi:two-component system, OmpR family, response regulator